MSIYWLLVGGEGIGSSRIHGINVHRELKKQGYDSELIIELGHYAGTSYITSSLFHLFEKFITEEDVVIIQKLSDRESRDLSVFLQSLGATVYFIDCDFPPSDKMAEIVDLIICPSTYLKELYERIGAERTICIPDGVEKSFYPKKLEGNSRKLTCAWFGSASNPEKWKSVLFLKDLFRSPQLSNWELVTFSNHPEADVTWSRDAFRQIQQCDAVAIPSVNLDDLAKCKSANRVTQSMAMGLPVLATPIPAYEEVIIQGKNGFLCRQPADWIQAFQKIEDPEVYNKISRNGFQTALSYSMPHVVDKWIDILPDPSNMEKDQRVKKSKALNELRRKVYLDILEKRPRLFYLRKAIKSGELSLALHKPTLQILKKQTRSFFRKTGKTKMESNRPSH